MYLQKAHFSRIRVAKKWKFAWLTLEQTNNLLELFSWKCEKSLLVTSFTWNPEHQIKNCCAVQFGTGIWTIDQRNAITIGTIKPVLLWLGCLIIYTKENIPNKRLKTWQQRIKMYYFLTSFWKSIYNWLKYIYLKIAELQKIPVHWTCSIVMQLWYVSWGDRVPSQGCKRGTGLPCHYLIFTRLEKILCMNLTYCLP